MHEKIIENQGFVAIIGDITNLGKLQGYECHIAREGQQGLITVGTLAYDLHVRLRNLSLSPEDRMNENILILEIEVIKDPDRVCKLLLATPKERLAPFVQLFSEEVQNQS